MRKLKKVVLIAVLLLAVMSVNAQFKILQGGDAWLPSGNSYRLGSQGETGTRLRLATTSSDAYIDFSNNLYFRTGDYGTNPIVKFTPSGITIGGAPEGSRLGIKHNSGCAIWVASEVGDYNHTIVTQANSDYTSCYSVFRGGDLRFFVRADGYVWARGVFINSDKRLKEGIRDVKEVNKLYSLNAKTYKFKHTSNTSQQLSAKELSDTASSKNNTNPIEYGFIAQEVQKLYPELVSCNKDSLLGVNYVAFIPLLVEALKEMNTKTTKQDSLLDKQNQTIKNLKSQVSTLIDCCEGKSNSKNKSLEIQSKDSQTATNIESAILYQNAPNPFSKTTEIRFYLPSSVKNAALYIYDMQGIQKKKIEVSQRANGSVTINGSEFVAGMYIYTLIADGKEIDTKRMILTE